MSTQVSKSANLQNKIDQLIQLQEEQKADLKKSATALMASLNPLHMLRSTIKDVSASPDLRSAAIDTAVGIGAGFLGRKLYVRNSSNILRKISGSAIQFFVTTFIRNKMSQARVHKTEKQEEE